MSRSLITLVALIGLTGLAGCNFLTGPLGLHGSAGRTVPDRPSMRDRPSMCGMCSGPVQAPRNHATTVLAGTGALTDNANDSYVAYGASIVSATESTVEIPVPGGGTLSNLKVFVTTAPGTGASWTLTVDKNGSATALTCSVAGAATSCSDSSLVAVVVGDTLDLGVTPFGKPELATVIWSATITP